MEKNILELCNIIGVCGNEHNISEYIKNKFRGTYDIKEDDFGNLVCWKETDKEAPGICFVTNMDESGFIVSGIDDNGLVHYEALGNNKNDCIGVKRVNFQNGVSGLVLGGKKDDRQVIDIGAARRKDAEEMIKIGDVAAFSEKAVVLGNSIIARNCYPRLGCAVLVSVMESIKTCKYNLYFAFAAQGMLANRGIAVLSNYLKADVFVSLDWIEAKELNEKPVIAIKDDTNFYDRELIDRLTKEANQQSLSCLTKVISGKNGLLQPFKKNCPDSKLLSLLYQLNYLGTGNEMVRASSLENLKTLIDIIVNSDNSDIINV